MQSNTHHQSKSSCLLWTEGFELPRVQEFMFLAKQKQKSYDSYVLFDQTDTEVFKSTFDAATGSVVVPGLWSTSHLTMLTLSSPPIGNTYLLRHNFELYMNFMSRQTHITLYVCAVPWGCSVQWGIS